MGFDSNGTYTRWNGPDTWKNAAASPDKRIKSDDHDSHDADLGSALSRTLLRDGTGGATANISMGGNLLINIGDPRDAVLTDVATVGFVKDFRDYTKAVNITGTDLDGRLNFKGPSGVNGITWTFADVSWVARKGKTGEGQDRLVMSSSVTPATSDTVGPGTTGDVFSIDINGRIYSAVGELMQNLSYDGSTYRTVAPGFGSLLNFNGGGFELLSNDVASITNVYATVTPRKYFSAINGGGVVSVNLFGSAAGKTMSLRSYIGSNRRWLMYLGDGTPESGVRKGSDFNLYSYANDDTAAISAIKIERETNKVTFGGEVVTTNLTTTDPIMTVGPATAQSSFSMQRPTSTGSFWIYGGKTVDTGAYIALYGDGQTANGRDIVLGSEGKYKYFYDYSANTHYWANNAGTQTMRLDTGLTVTGTLNVTSTATFSALTITDSNIQVGPSTAASVFQMSRPVTDGSLTIYGSTSSTTGAYMALYGNAHTTAGNDIVMGSSSVARWHYDYSVGQHAWSHSAQLMRVNATEGLVVAGHVTSAGTVTSSQNFDSTSTTCILSAGTGGNIRLRPDGPTDAVTQTTIDTSGNVILCNGTSTTPVPTGGIYAGLGIRTKDGTNGLYGDEFYNFNWASSQLKFYYGITTSNVTVTTCDYRIKRDIVPLRSVWDKIKALKPISYRQKAFQMWEDDDAERWGLVAHEAQDALGKHAATGEKDGEEIQTLSAVSLITALTRGLQEAMERIEALEAA